MKKSPLTGDEMIRLFITIKEIVDNLKFMHSKSITEESKIKLQKINPIIETINNNFITILNEYSNYYENLCNKESDLTENYKLEFTKMILVHWNEVLELGNFNINT